MSRASVARGGKAVYGAAVGILMLEARFPRIPGDVGNAATWPFPVLYKVVRGRLAGARGAAARRRAAGGIRRRRARAGRAWAPTASPRNCGFLSLFQEELAAARRGVPVATSALMQAPADRAAAAARQAGRHPDGLGAQPEPEHLKAAGVAPDTPVAAPRAAASSRGLLGDELHAGRAAGGARTCSSAGEALVARHPEVGAVLLECTNMCPYAAALRARLGLPVFDMVSFVTWFHGGLVPRRWPA